MVCPVGSSGAFFAREEGQYLSKMEIVALTFFSTVATTIGWNLIPKSYHLPVFCVSSGILFVCLLNILMQNEGARPIRRPRAFTL